MCNFCCDQFKVFRGKEVTESVGICIPQARVLSLHQESLLREKRAIHSQDREIVGSICVDRAADCAVDCVACAVSMRLRLRGRCWTRRRRRRHARWGHANVDLEDGDGEVDGGGKFLAGPGGGGGGINFPRVVMLIDTSTRGSIAGICERLRWTNEKCPAAF